MMLNYLWIAIKLCIENLNSNYNCVETGGGGGGACIMCSPFNLIVLLSVAVEMEMAFSVLRFSLP